MEGQAEYYLEVVKDSDLLAGGPKWPRPEAELIVGSQPLDSGYTQYWAYPAESGKDAADLPHAEVIASEYRPHKPAILIDQYGPEGNLELILVKDGHAWGKAQSSLDNLEDNISTLLDFAQNQLNIKVEHFMTTSRVSEEVEKKLDDLESAGEGVTVDEPTAQSVEDQEGGVVDESSEVRPLSARPAVSLPASGILPPSGPALSDRNRPPGSSKVWIVPVVAILAVFAGAIFFKDQVINKLGGQESKQEVVPTPTPISTPTPTPTPTVERSQYKVRVLNGTTKTGAAATLAESLKEKGWETLSVGNATSSAVPQTYVRVKDGLDQVLEVMTLDLAGEYEAASSSALKSSDKADVEVVIGKK